MRRLIFFLLTILIFSYGCGSGGGGGSSSQENTPKFTLNSQGFPIVAGTYSLNLGKMTNDCGEPDDPPQFLGNMLVAQDGDSINMELTNSSMETLEASGWTVTETSPMLGTISKSAEFTASSGSTLQHNTLGTLYINEATNGSFTLTGASGTYGFTIFDDFGNACTYKASLSAKKV